MTPLPPTPLSNATRGQPRPRTSVSLTIWLSIWVLAIIALCTVVIPKFEKIFQDFHTSLPMTTVLMLWVSHLLCTYLGWVLIIDSVPFPIRLYVWMLLLPIPILVPFAFSAVFNANAPSQQRKIFWANRIAVLLILLTTISVIVGLFAPMISLIGAVSGSSGAK